MKNKKLFEAFSLGGLDLQNRLVMAPLTRQRSSKGNVPNRLMAEYYKQRSSAGLIITEGAQISWQGYGYYDAPGIHTEQQLKGWKKVTKAVHRKNGRIFLQLWHVGRHSHPYYQEDGKLPVAPSAIKENGHIRVPEGKLDTITPHALERTEIASIVEDYHQATLNAREAGFDGVEIHAANGYLIDQFLHDGSNQREDEYGGSIANRLRFMKEVLESVCDAWEPARVGIRLSPSGQHGDMHDKNPRELFTQAIKELNQYRLAYLHLVEPLNDVSKLENYVKEVAKYYREFYEGTLISCGGYTPRSAEQALQEGIANLIAFGRLFIANPDLPERIRRDAGLNDWIPELSTEEMQKVIRIILF